MPLEPQPRQSGTISGTGETTTMCGMSLLLPSPLARRPIDVMLMMLMAILKLAAVSVCLSFTAASAQSSISVDRFGAGNAFRPGGSVAVRVRVQSDLDEPVPGLLQWETVNGDGDIVANTREIAVPARGGVAVTWLVANLPSDSSASNLLGRIWTFRLFEFRDGVREEEIAVARIDATMAQARPVEQYQGMAMVIG
ncbi:MAG: hypothetical protein OSA40_13830, partial [Phycisphaerales bacterium]|nr:hypothetical protein [Phycisphaerales bacterium]